MDFLTEKIYKSQKRPAYHMVCRPFGQSQKLKFAIKPADQLQPEPYQLRCPHT